MKIAIITDGGSGLSKKEAEALGLFYLPLQIIDGSTTYLDGVDIACEEVYAMIKEGKLMKTSLPPYGLIEELLTKLKEEKYDHAICIPLSSGLSSSSHSIALCAKDVGLDLTIIETYTTCFIQQYLARAAKQLVDEKVALDEIICRLNKSVKDSDTLIIPDDLDHLKRGGRLTPIAAALGGMLKIKPILKLNASSEGKIDTYAKVRTMSKAISTAIDAFVEKGMIDDEYVLVCVDADALEARKQMEEEYFSKFPNTVQYTGNIGPVLAVHTGLGCLGIQYIKKV